MTDPVATVWPERNDCKRCGWQLSIWTGQHRTHDASIWDGASWKMLRHGTKICTNPTCGLRYKLNYIAEVGSKENTLTTTTNNPIILLHTQLGFTHNYLVQLWHRMCRTGTSAAGEAATICLTYPNIRIAGCTAKSTAKGGAGHLSEKGLGLAIMQAVFCFLRLQEGVHDFDVNDPVPCNGKEFDITNTGLHVIFCAARDDPNYNNSAGKLDVVTDGNFQCSRRLLKEEKKYAKHNLPGRPKTKKVQKQMKTHGGPISKSRCKAVNQIETMKVARTQTGGLYGTVNMKNRKGGNNEILHLAEMLNGENTEYKKACLQDMKAAKMTVGKYACDCGCVVRHHFEGHLCDKCYLDGYHGKKHKCNTPSIIHQKRLNSQACEQLWSRLDKLHWVSRMTRPRYRCFLLHYCLWRNANTSGRSRPDACPCVSLRKRMKRTPRRR